VRTFIAIAVHLVVITLFVRGDRGVLVGDYSKEKHILQLISILSFSFSFLFLFLFLFISTVFCYFFFVFLSPMYKYCPWAPQKQVRSPEDDKKKRPQNEKTKTPTAVHGIVRILTFVLFCTSKSWFRQAARVP
jgi:nicotinamide riboside transporter PnuC